MSNMFITMLLFILHFTVTSCKITEGEMDYMKLAFSTLVSEGLCPNNWSLEEGRPMCYSLVEISTSWEQAQEHCQTISDNKVKLYSFQYDSLTFECRVH